MGEQEQQKEEDPQNSNNKPSLDLEQIKGLGDLTIAKLNALGYYSARDLAVGNSTQISSVTQKSIDYVFNHFIVVAKELVNKYDDFHDDTLTSPQCEELELNRKKLKTGIDALDDLLGGGIETRCITEFYGRFGSGKSQLCFTLSVLALLPEKDGGLGGNVMYIDAEGTYSGLRVLEILRERKLDPEIRHGIYKKRPGTATYLESYVDKLPFEVVEKNIKLVIVDSIIILHRQEYIGREQLSRRQQSLSEMMNKLLKLAESHNLAVVITNQVSSDPGADPKYHQEVDHATGGNVIAHASSHRIHLERFGQKIKATMVDSPRLERTECLFTLGKKGIEKYVQKKKEDGGE